MHQRPLPKNVREWHAHFEASYCDLMVCLASDIDMDKTMDALVKFRVFKKMFYFELLKFGRKPGLVTSMDEFDRSMEFAMNARGSLLDCFPAHAGKLKQSLASPVAFLPFIKFFEDPFSDVLGQTIKFDEGDSMIMIKSGSGKEIPTLMHEQLHASARGLPPVFEEGFCRYSLQSKGIDQNDVREMLDNDMEKVRYNFGGIYYPTLLVEMLSQLFGDEKIALAFFRAELADMDRTLKNDAGIGFSELDKPYKENVFRGSVKALAKLVEAFESGLSEQIKDTIRRLAGISNHPPPHDDGKIPMKKAA